MGHINWINRTFQLGKYGAYKLGKYRAYKLGKYDSKKTRVFLNFFLCY